jgi:hypothetical protein
MTRLLLHIGSPKAGSSAIQASLAAQAAVSRRWDWSSQRWICLPPNPYGKPYPSGFIAARYLEPQHLPRYIKLRRQANPAGFEGDVERYHALLKRQLQPRLRPRPAGALLSCEYLWRIPAAAVAQLKAEFEAMGVEQFRVVAYVREPSAVYGSALQQWARLSTQLQRFDPHQWRYDLRKRLEAWASVFGEALLVRPFDRGQLPGGCVVADFQQQAAAWVGEPCWPLQLQPAPAVNSSATTEELLAMQELMRGQPANPAGSAVLRTRDLGRLWDQLAAITAVQQGSKIQLLPAVAHVIRTRHQADLEWLAEAHGVQFPDPLEGDQAFNSWPDPGATDGAPALQDLLQSPRHGALLQTLRQRLADVVLPG